ncbi:uncharacterized protein LOC120635904 [Pararge aegeria]|uniref:uncharacterized protein LOC120635904 n=1 Tax=Pararge aegeria TaxID=116150 RepID=UPI0019D02056|nr:uncharacterized protein LOC120635904 [Pararge aegeria]
MSVCYVCNVKVTVTQKRVKCSLAQCSYLYHLECVELPEDSPAVRSKWVCPACVASRPKGDNSNTPVQNKIPGLCDKVDPPAFPVTLFSDSETMVSVNAMQDLIRAEIKSMACGINDLLRESIGKELKSIKIDLSEFKSSFEMFSAKYEEISKRVDNIEINLKMLKSTNSEINAVCTSLNKIETELNTKEQWARRSNIEIIGVPEKKGENLLVILKELCLKADFPINPDIDIDFVTHVAPSINNLKKPKPIIVRFLARHKKDNCLNRLRKLKNLQATEIGFVGSNSSVYFNDHLTRANKVLLQQAKKRAQEMNYKYTWVKHCCILVRRDDTSPIINILSAQDLNSIK